MWPWSPSRPDSIIARHSWSSQSAVRFAVGLQDDIHHHVPPHRRRRIVVAVFDADDRNVFFARARDSRRYVKSPSVSQTIMSRLTSQTFDVSSGAPGRSAHFSTMRAAPLGGGSCLADAAASGNRESFNELVELWRHVKRVHQQRRRRRLREPRRRPTRQQRRRRLRSAGSNCRTRRP